MYNVFMQNLQTFNIRKNSEAFVNVQSLMVTEQVEWSPTLASGTGGWVESAPVPQVEEEVEGVDHPRESEDKVLHQRLGCGMYGIASLVTEV